MANFTEMTIAKAINAGLRKALSENDKILVFGEDVAERLAQTSVDRLGNRHLGEVSH